MVGEAGQANGWLAQVIEVAGSVVGAEDGAVEGFGFFAERAGRGLRPTVWSPALTEPIGQLQGGVDDRLAHLLQDWFGPAAALRVDGREGAAADKARGQDGGSARAPCVPTGVVVAGEDVPGSESSLPHQTQ